MEPLACRMRPTSFDDIIGQDHLVGKNGVIRKMIEKNQLFSMILYGDPGIGKTSIANIIASYYPLNVFEYNASIDNKAKLKDIADSNRYYNESILIIDEIHRMKKDVQDFLLPFMEKGSLTIIGLTTLNPYQSINPAIRSRCHIYKLNNIKINDVSSLLKKVAAKEYPNYTYTDDCFEYLAYTANSEIRTALNMLEAVSLIGDEKAIDVEVCKSIIGKPSLKLDSGEDNYYDVLSAFQKSIRGSDVDASLHYLARLITLEDIEIICRRLMVIAYEDIGLANPQVGPRVMAACDAARKLGFPEARIPLSAITIDLALSPKSNSAEASIDLALEDYSKGGNFEIPKNILNRELKAGAATYLYPHDFEGGWVDQQYLPSQLKGHHYYEGKETGAYERALKARNEEIKSIKKK